MEQLNETQRYFIEEHVEDFRDGLIPRRELIRRVTLIAGSAALATSILAACDLSPRPAATTSSPAAASPALVAQPFALAKPAAASGKVPGVVVIHENRGQTEHIKDVVRRVATAGFVAINIDLAARAGGAAKLVDSAAYNAELGKRGVADKLADHNATFAYLRSQTSGTAGVVGFCFGGGEVWNILAGGAPTELKAAVPFYGPQPANYTELSKVKAAVSAVYAEQDTRITATAPQMEEVLKQAGVPYAITVYPGVNHAFHNDTNAAGDRYNATQAQKAWVATIEWFRKYLA
ncbi:MAG: dienelactone hydrolase family protein [Chloroflexi bacterium]|nr:MAG: dienelactone hydrolase family protein [Chloroflexota bacterium]